MINEKCIYFRKVAAVADDDAAADSASFPVSQFKGLAYSNAANHLIFYFNGMHDFNPIPSSAQLDSVSIVIVSDAKARIVIGKFITELQTGTNPTIVVYDEVDDSSSLFSSTAVPSYISSVNAITINTS